jgi:hypothetical protein
MGMEVRRMKPSKDLAPRYSQIEQMMEDKKDRDVLDPDLT